ncbi:hypothetical protein [Novipirellula sp.]|uniref:hypothetical protein n=1 Tax=Novipirellula sp. TaxID=2795430 RepID=UPI003567EA40
MSLFKAFDATIRRRRKYTGTASCSSWRTQLTRYVLRRAAEAAEQQRRNQAIIERQQRRSKRKHQIEANRIEMQKGIATQLEARSKSREGRDLDAEMQAIDAETMLRIKPVHITRTSC